MPINATLFKLVAPNETSECFITSTTTTIEREMKHMNKTLNKLPFWKGGRFEFLRYPSCDAVKILDGTFKDHDDLHQFLEHLIDITPNDHHNSREWLESVLKDHQT